ncbi:hypothetical protein ACP4OV_020932 [Aristida adscensionis]
MDLVVGALSGMVDALPGMLGDLLEQEYALLAGARGDVEFLQRELRSMRAAVRHCESLHHPDAQTTAWVGRVRELALDIEDWVDFFAVRVDGGAGAGDHPPPSSRLTSWLRHAWDKTKTLPARHAIAGELSDLKERAVELSEQRDRYRYAAPVPAEPRAVDPRLAALFADAGSLVGLDAPVEEVCRLVGDAGDGAELKILSITGMAGSGKTTLARAVFQQLKQQSRFHCHAFVSVGQKPEMVKTLGDMLSQLGGERHGWHGSQDMGQLIESLRELLETKRYLVVVDDLWSRGHWEALRCCLPDNNHGSRIITTTRNDALPTDNYSCSSKIVHKISLLSDADAKNLFLKRAFGNVHRCPQHLEGVLDKIMRKCEGLPLAVVRTADKLAHKPARDEWERVALNSLWISDSDGVKQILNLSYNNLPTNLKTGLLYLSLFPENSEIDTERLVRRWIAEGIVAETHGASAEETARGYLNELMSRNLVQPLHLNHDGIPKYCKVHPVMHDFIVCKSMEENFATLVDTQRQCGPNNNTIRRLSLKNSSKQDQYVARNEPLDLSHARSITVFGHASAMPQLADLKVVRVLDLEGCNGPMCLDGLCKLLLLRYLSLKDTEVSELPVQIGELRCLETLDVRSTKVKELPPSIVKLGKLMHLLAGSAKLPDEIVKMKALQTLSCSANAMENISQIANLRELELFCDVTEMPENEKGVAFPGDGFRGVKQLFIRCSLPSVTFEPRALPAVQVLELRFEKGPADESSGVSGIEHLSSLKHVLVEFGQQDAGAMVIADEVRKATNSIRLEHREVTVKVDWKS